LLLEDKFLDFKITARPETYSTFSLEQQFGLYFLLSGKEEALCRVLKRPQFRVRSGEHPSQIRERARESVLSRPNSYFIDLHFFRAELDLEEVKRWALLVREEIFEKLKRGKEAFFQNRLACLVPGPCPFLPGCEVGPKLEGFAPPFFKQRPLVEPPEPSNYIL